jgi:hypothetical protein
MPGPPSAVRTIRFSLQENWIFPGLAVNRINYSSVIKKPTWPGCVINRSRPLNKKGEEGNIETFVLKNLLTEN